MLGALRVMPKYAAAGPPVSGYVGWWDASDATSITSSGGAVSQWNDKSGNGYHVSTVAAVKPSTGTRTLNGMNVIDWPNTGGQNLSRTVALSQPLTVFAVIATDATNAAQHYWFADVTAYQEGTPSTWRLYAGSVLNSGVSVDTSAHTMTSIFNGASSQLFKDGTQIGATSNAGSTGITKISIGGGTITNAPWDGLIAEVVLYTSALGASDRQSVESYLKAKWGTP